MNDAPAFQIAEALRAQAMATVFAAAYAANVNNSPNSKATDAVVYFKRTL